MNAVRGTALGRLAAAVALACACSPGPPPPGGTEDPPASQPRDPAALFVFGDVEISGGGARSSLRARHVEARRRKSLNGVLTYHDLYELVVWDAVFEGTRAEPPSLDWSLFDVAQRFFAGQASPIGLDRGEEGARGVALSRVIFDDLRARLVAESGEQVEVVAEAGRLDLERRVLVLSRGVRLVPRTGPAIETRWAAFAPALAGVLLPDGYTTEGRTIRGRALLVSAVDGSLVPSRTIPRIDFVDALEDREILVLRHVVEKLPSALRPIVLAVLAQRQREQEILEPPADAGP